MAYKFGNEPYVQIGTQKWQRRNLDVSTYANGDIIPYIKDPIAWNTLTTGAWRWYNNDSELGKIYGKQYNYYAVNDPRGLAPEGWRLSTEDDWDTLANYLGGASVAGEKLKSTSGWQNSGNGTNSSGFNALPGGFFNQELTRYGTWWVETSIRNLLYNSNSLTRAYPPTLQHAISVRCIKD